MKKFDFKIRGNDYHVHLMNIDDGNAEIEVNGTLYKVHLQEEQHKAPAPVSSRRSIQGNTTSASPNIASAKKGPGLVKAPLPGTIFKIMVKEGDTIKKGDLLLIMEAMKMENELHTDVNGIVKSVKVKENESVLEGDILIEIEVG